MRVNALIDKFYVFEHILLDLVLLCLKNNIVFLQSKNN